MATNPSKQVRGAIRSRNGARKYRPSTAGARPLKVALRKIFAGLLLVTGVVLIAGSYFTAMQLLPQSWGTRRSRMAREFGLGRRKKLVSVTWVSAAAWLWASSGAAICWGVPRLQIGLPTYQGSGRANWSVEVPLRVLHFRPGGFLSRVLVEMGTQCASCSANLLD